jgi:N-acetylneuraminate synthase
MEFTSEQWAGLAHHAQEKGLIFLSSPFSIEAVELLEKLKMPAWKIGSGEITNLPMIERICRALGPVLLSSGLSDIGELDETVRVISAAEKEFAILQCTSEYPSPPEKAGLNLLSSFAERWKCPVGFSDHSGKIFAGLAAVSWGASIIEVHVALSKKMFGPDVSSSLTIDELETLSDGIKEIHLMRMHPVDKDVAFHQTHVQSMRSIFGRSIYAKQDLAAGSKLNLQHLAFKKPGSGIPAKDYKQVIGKTLRRAVRTDERILSEDLE